jgi:DNA replication protein DnaC
VEFRSKFAEVQKWKYGATGLLLHGMSRHCKTRSAWQLLRRLYVEEGRSLVVFDAVSFSHAITKHFGPDGKGERWTKEIVHAPAVFFDDFGKCRLTERGESELFGIIENRMAYKKPIIITTNFVGDTLAARLRDDVAEPLVQRLRECCTSIAF